MSAAAVEPAPRGDAERPDDDADDESFGSDSRFTLAAGMYLIYYNLGTVVFGFAEPRTDLLIAPVFAIGGVLRLIGMSDRITSSGLTAAKLLLPILGAALTVTACVMGWWPL